MPPRVPAPSAAALSGAIALVIGLLTLNHLPVGGFYDDGFYVILAKSLATGHGYRNLNLPGAPFAAHYPPGYPALLALFWRLGPAFPANLILFKAVNAALLGVIAYATCTFARRVLALPPAGAVFAALLGTITIPPLALANMLLSEPLFLALLVPTLAMADRAFRDGPSRRDAIVIGALCAALVLVRSIGALIIVAIGGMFLLRRAWRSGALYLGVTLLLLAPWGVWTSLHGGDLPPVLHGAHGSYLGWFTGGVRADGLTIVWHTAVVNVAAMAAGLAPSFRVMADPAQTALVLTSLVFLWAMGAWRTLRRAPATLAFLSLYLALIVVWPGAPLRFIWGVWPLLMLVLVVPLASLTDAAVPRPVRFAIAVAAASLVPGMVRYNIEGYRKEWWGSIARSMGTRAAPAIQWARAHTAPSDVITSEYEAMLYLYADRESVPVSTFTAEQYLHERTTAENAGVLRDIVETFHPRYVIVSSAPFVAAAQVLTGGPAPTLVLTDSLSGTSIFTTTAARSPGR
jgi:hypothetical protein